MKFARTDAPTPRPPLRLLPGLAAAGGLLLLRFGVPIVAPEAVYIGILGGLLFGLAIVIWWAFFSRAPRFDRWSAVLLMIVALAATPRVLHESIATGMMGMMFYIYAIPVLGLAVVAAAVAGRGLAERPRRAAMAVAILLACGGWALLRTDGILGGGGAQLAWRWSPTAEEQLLAQAGDEPMALPFAPERAEAPAEELVVPDAGKAVGTTADDEPAAAPSAPASAGAVAEPLPIETDKAPPTASPKARRNADWPGFRGTDRDGIVHGVRIETDWAASPPRELWRRPVGPGWSSFAVHGGLIYTQEQRGDDEVVACYRLATGEPVWMHRDATRFWESNAGAGPRGTPTVRDGRVYTFGATGILNALDAVSGAVSWSRNAASDTGEKVPTWGFASSPLVANDTVIVAAAGKLAAYDITSGEPRWVGPAEGASYSSPQRMTIGGVAQILLMSKAGATSVAPADGKLLWQVAWPGFASLQPALTADGDVLITTSGDTGGIGIRRLAVTHGTGGWTAEQRWTSLGLKPYFNDFVVHEGHAYGFDGRILSCIDLKDGERKWKGGRFGNGQLILLADQDLLLVLSDKGELALVGASPSEFKELARFPAITGKTWNHPVLAGDIVLVRNDREMAAFRVALAGG